jgi:hypothetical protein
MIERLRALTPGEDEGAAAALTIMRVLAKIPHVGSTILKHSPRCDVLLHQYEH